MAVWRFLITKEAEDDLANLDRQARKRVIVKLGWFAENFDRVIPLPLGGAWRGFFKLRIGDMRVIYEIDDAMSAVVVHMIDRRDQIYKRRK